MYTQFSFTFSLKDDTPIKIINILEYLIDSENNRLPFISMNENDKLFNTKTKRFQYMLNTSSCYFTDISYATLQHNKCGGYSAFHCIASIKNYDNDIELFIDFVKDYIYLHGEEKLFVGWSRYEEDEKPILYYLYDNNIISKKED